MFEENDFFSLQHVRFLLASVEYIPLVTVPSAQDFCLILQILLLFEKYPFVFILDGGTKFILMILILIV
jgi:hypothetical protein